MTSFFSPYSHDFLRVGACVPHVAVADPRQNAENVLALLAEGDRSRIALMVFPELGLSAYAIDDLLFQDAMLDEVERQIDRLIAASRELFPVFVAGAPLRHRGHLYNCGVAIHRGELLGVVPKVYLPNYREFHERRQLTSGEDVIGQAIEIAGRRADFGRDLLFAARGKAAFTFHVEICEDLWVPHPPSTDAALAGAEILLNLSASNITIGKAEFSNAATCSPRPSVFRPIPRWRSPMSISAASAKSGCARIPSVTMHALPTTATRRSARSRSISRRPRSLSNCAARSSAFRMYRPIRRCCARTVTKLTTSRCRAWPNALRRRG